MAETDVACVCAPLRLKLAASCKPSGRGVDNLAVVGPGKVPREAEKRKATSGGPHQAPRSDRSGIGVGVLKVGATIKRREVSNVQNRSMFVLFMKIRGVQNRCTRLREWSRQCPIGPSGCSGPTAGRRCLLVWTSTWTSTTSSSTMLDYNKKPELPCDPKDALCALKGIMARSGTGVMRSALNLQVTTGLRKDGSADGSFLLSANPT